MNTQDINIVRIRTVSQALGPLAGEVVFVGGATVAMYATDPAAEEVRPTDDVDIVVELATYGAYAALEERLRQLGFVNDRESGVICRYVVQGLIVDVMPTEGSVLGFRNRWYPDGFRTSIGYQLDADNSVRIFDSPYFLASKLDAFHDRGGGDGRISSDFEDLTYVMNNRKEIWHECSGAPDEVKQFLREAFEELLKISSIHEWFACQLEYQFADEQARQILVEMKEFVRLE